MAGGVAHNAPYTHRKHTTGAHQCAHILPVCIKHQAACRQLKAGNISVEILFRNASAFWQDFFRDSSPIPKSQFADLCSIRLQNATHYHAVKRHRKSPYLIAVWIACVKSIYTDQANGLHHQTGLFKNFALDTGDN